MEDQKGQTLVEMIVIIGMVVLLATGVVAATTVSLSRSETSQLRSDALTYAQSGIELARALRDTSWETFAAMGKPTANTYCVDSLGSWNILINSNCPININSKFTRSVTLELTTVSEVSTMKVTSGVSWGDNAVYPSNPANSVDLTTYLTQWK